MSTETTAQQFMRVCRRYLAIQQLENPDARLAELRSWLDDLAPLYTALLTEVESGCPEVWYALGHGASHGWGTPRDPEKAKDYFQRAAIAGHAGAMVRLGFILRRDETDQSLAAEWFRRAADRGESSGMVWMGFSYREGNGVPCDFVMAARWFETAAATGDDHSWIHAGRVYSRHLNQASEALRCFTSAANAGQIESHLELAFLHADRSSAFYHPEEAIKWYEKVASHNGGSRPRAMIELAHYHRNGEGTPQDRAVARLWLLRALECARPNSEFHREAARLLDQMRGELL